MSSNEKSRLDLSRRHLMSGTAKAAALAGTGGLTGAAGVAALTGGLAGGAGLAPSPARAAEAGAVGPGELDEYYGF
ncbi:MAG: TAT-dependent nitrous-oxide reductase, partial [Geminicoccaceae bacterium]|nr:TAT-dependent nitrous-oxide reductase [Geminicoccaceae bacterium]